MIRRALLLVWILCMAVFMSSCGQTYKLVSISASPSTGCTLTSQGQTCQLAITALYSNSKTADVTLKSSYSIGQSPLFNANVNTVNPNPEMPIGNDGPGVIQALTTVAGCSYAGTSSGGTTTYQAAPYTVTVTYTNDGIPAQTAVPIMVETESPCPPAS